MINNGIFVYENAIKPNLCKRLIKLYKDNRLSPDLLHEDYSDGMNVKCKYIMTTPFKSIDEELTQVMCDVLDRSTKDYTFNGKTFLHCSGDSGYQLREVYGATRLHADQVVDPSNPGRSRLISIVIALNSDYEGGIFNFPLQNYKVKLKQGEAVVFPAAHTHPHEVSAPKNGTLRYTINTWLFS